MIINFEIIQHNNSVLIPLFLFWTRNCLPSWYLLFQSKQWKQQNNAWNLFRFNNKDTRRTSGVVLMLTDCTHCLGVLITDFEQVNAGWVSGTAGTCKFNVIINAIYINVLNINLNSLKLTINNAQKMKFYIVDFLSKCDQIHRKLRIWSHLMTKYLMENFIFVQSNMFEQPVII